jgi:hypothetical protein
MLPMPLLNVTKDWPKNSCGSIASKPYRYSRHRYVCGANQLYSWIGRFFYFIRRFHYWCPNCIKPSLRSLIIKKRPVGRFFFNCLTTKQPYQPVISFRPLPISARLRTVLTPASSRAANFSSAVPLPPETMAPAWPMRFPAGAVTPAM